MAGDNFNSMFTVDFESYASVSKKLGVLTKQVENDKASSIKLNFDTDLIKKTIADLSNLTGQKITILENGQVKLMSQMNDETGKLIKLTQNLSTGKQAITIDNTSQLRQIENTEKMYKKMFDTIELNSRKQQANAVAEEKSARELIKVEQEKLRIKQQNIEISRKGLINEPYSNNIKSGINSMDAKTMEEARKQASMYSRELQKLDQMARMQGIRVGSQNVTTMGEAFRNTAVSLGIFMTSAMVLRQIVNVIRDSVQYVIQLDQEMTSLKKVTAETNATYSEFLATAHSMSLELGSQSDKIVQAVTSWAKTGKSIAEATELARSTMLLTKVGDIDNIATAQQYMIAPLKAFGIEADKSITLIDKYNNVSNNMATEVTDVGNALSQSASSMAVAGNSLEQSIAIVATAQSATQLGGNVIGNA